MEDSHHIHQLLHVNFPQLHITALAALGEGSENEAWLVNNRIVFRFPKSKSAMESLNREIILLPLIRPSFNIDIPRFIYIPKEWGFAGYKRINGIPLTAELYNTLTPGNRIMLLKQLAHFLTTLHATTPESILPAKLLTLNPLEEYQDNLEKCKQLVFPDLSPANCGIITEKFISYFQNPGNVNYIPALLHNDLSGNHILIDDTTKSLSGIIDFGDVAFGDPDYDLMYLYDEMGELFIINLLQFYRQDSKVILFSKLRFYQLANKIQIIIAGKEENNSHDIESGFKALFQWLSNNK